MFETPSPDRVTIAPTLRFPIVTRLAAALTTAVLLAACQTDGSAPPKLSLEEAKQVTSTFAGSLEAPPRTINDILFQLGQFRVTPEDCSIKHRLSDEEIFETAASLPPPKPGSGGRAYYLAEQASLQFQNGDFPRSIKFQDEAVDQISSDIPGFRARNLAVLATYYAYGKHFDAAESAMSRAVSTSRRVKKSRWGGNEQQYAFFRYHLELASAAVAEGNGDLSDAEVSYRQATDLARQAYLIGYDVDFGKMALARNLMRQGRLSSAENSIRESIGPRLRSRHSWPIESSSILLALVRLSEVLYEQSRYEEAAQLARKAVDLYRSICAAPGNLNLALVNDLLGRALAAQGRWTEVVGQYEAIRADMSNDPGSFDRLFTGNLYWALALLRTGQTTKAVEQLEVALRRTRERLGDKHYKTAEIRGYLAMAQSAHGDSEAAIGEFRDVVPVLLRRSRQADEDSSTVTARNRRLNIILEAYIGLLAQSHNTSLDHEPDMEAVGEAFMLAEHARSRVVLQALSASGARAVLSDPELADLARKEQDTQKRIAALYGTLAEVVSRPNDQQDNDLTESLKVKIDKLPRRAGDLDGGD